jgi:hypothetical protein
MLREGRVRKTKIGGSTRIAATEIARLVEASG